MTPKKNSVGLLFAFALALGAGIAWSQFGTSTPEATSLSEVAVVEAPREDTMAEAAADADPGEALAIEAAEEPEVAEPEPAVDPAESEAPAAETNGDIVRIPVLPIDPEQQMQGDMVTLSLLDVPLTDVVTLFVRLSGANIISSPTQLTGRVSVNLKEVHWRTALTEILSMHDLVLYESQPGSQLYTITPPKAEAAIPLYTETFTLSYARAEQVSNGVARLLAPNGSVLQASGRTLAILATVNQIEKTRTFILDLDRMIPQVAIEAKFVELNDEAIKKLGINWKVLDNYTMGVTAPSLQYSRDEQKRSLSQDADVVAPFSRSSTSRIDSSMPEVESGTTSTSQSGVTEAAIRGRNFTEFDSQENTLTTVPVRDVTTIKASSAILSAADFAIALSALQENTGIEIVTNPKVVVSSGETANIHVGQKRPNIVKRTTSTQGGTTDVSYEYGNPEWIEIGAKVMVLPVVNTESNITVNIQPELNRQVGTIEPQPGLTFPILVTRRVESEFVIQSGQTVAIGGLTSTEDREVVSKIPFLGDIPILGRYLFSHKETRKYQDETIIFVTVGLAKPEEMNQNTGVPSHGSLIYEKFQNPATGQIELRNRRREKFEEELRRKSEASETAGLKKTASAE
jgi:type II secretory pathway component GspD/PulD (secretin)